MVLAPAACSVSRPALPAPQSGALARNTTHLVEERDSPFLVDWEATQLAALDAAMQNDGALVVAYDGPRLRLLENCHVTGRYVPKRVTEESGHVRLRSAEDAAVGVALIPGLEQQVSARVERGSSVDFKYTVLGKTVHERLTARTSELSGNCRGATHFIRAVFVGAFERADGETAGISANTTVLGVDGTVRTKGSRSIGTTGGDPVACAHPADAESTENVRRCAAPLRLILEPIKPSVYVHLTLDSFDVVSKRDANGGVWDGSGSLPDPEFFLGDDAHAGPFENTEHRRGSEPLVDHFEVPENGWTLHARDNDGFGADDMGEARIAPDDVATSGTISKVLKVQNTVMLRVKLSATVTRDAIPAG